MKVNGPGRSKLGQGRNSRQCAKHAWVNLEKVDLNFAVRSTSSRDDEKAGDREDLGF